MERFNTRQKQKAAGFKVGGLRSDRAVLVKESEHPVSYRYDGEVRTPKLVADWKVYDYLSQDVSVASDVNLCIENLYNFGQSGQGMSIHNDVKNSPSL